MLYNLDILEENQIQFNGEKYKIKNPTVSDYYEYMNKLQKGQFRDSLTLAKWLLKKCAVKSKIYKRINPDKLTLSQLNELIKILTEIMLGKNEKKN